MEDLTSEVFARMQQEDSWLASDSGILTMRMAKTASFVPDGIEATIEIAEHDTTEFKDSAALHAFLASKYRILSEELSPELKIRIERDKLRRFGKEYLLDSDYFSKGADEILASLPHKGNDLGENIQAAIDMMASWNALAYLDYNNCQRSYSNLVKALKLSGENPIVFKYLIEPSAIKALLGFSDTNDLGLLAASVTGNNPTAQWFASEYLGAKERLRLN